MKKYIRTQDGRIMDLGKFIDDEKDTPYYKDFIFDELTKDGELKWTAIGTEQNSMEEQRGRRCKFSITFTLSEIIAQANTIEELIDEFVLHYNDTIQASIPIPWATYERRGIWKKEREHIIKEIVNHPSYRQPVLFGAIWTDEGLIYVAKMNDEGELKLL